MVSGTSGAPRAARRRRRRPRAAGGAAYAPRVRLGSKIAAALAAFGLVTLIAEAAGAANLGTALGIGQVAFAAVLVGLLLLA